jgi:xanthine dehydrogenase accessory factor
MHDIHEIASICATWQNCPEKVVALVTLVECEGSSYRKVGARMMVLEDGSTVGTISGGCLEGDLAGKALSMAEIGEAFAIEAVDTRPVFGCHGVIRLFIENWQMRSNELNAVMTTVQTSLEQRKSVTLSTRYGASQPNRGTSLCEATNHSAPGMLVQKFGKKKRVIIVGAHLDAQPVIEQIQMLGWDAVQIIPGRQRNGWVCSDETVQTGGLTPDEIVHRFTPDEATAIVLMTHNLGRDVEFASRLLREPYLYIGMLGSRKRRSEVFDHLMDAHIEDVYEHMERLHCPIGLDIGSETSAEIALSIVSEIKAVFSEKGGGLLKFSDNPIHQEVSV